MRNKFRTTLTKKSGTIKIDLIDSMYFRVTKVVADHGFEFSG